MRKNLHACPASLIRRIQEGKGRKRRCGRTRRGFSGVYFPLNFFVHLIRGVGARTGSGARYIMGVVHHHRLVHQMCFSSFSIDWGLKIDVRLANWYSG